MIIIIARAEVNRIYLNEYVELANELAQQSRHEEGCLEYSLVRDIENENVFVCIEKWSSQEAINQHNNSTHFTTIVTQLAKMRVSSCVNKYIEVR